MTVARLRIIRLVLAATAALVIFGVIGAGQAGATGYQVWSCTDRISDNARAGTGFWFSFTGTVGNHCPDGLEFWNGDDLHDHNYGFSWQWVQSAGDSRLSRVTLTMKGGDTTGGLVYEVAAGPGEDAFATLPPREPGDPDLTTPVDVPEGIRSITFRARCAAETCSGSSYLRINEIKFRIDDSTPPSTSMVTDPNLNFEASGETTGSVPWFRPDSLPIGVRVYDGGSGVQSAALRMDTESDPPLWSANSTCLDRWEFMNDAPPAIVYESPQVCNGDLRPPSLLNLRGKSEGRHKLTLNATDALDRASEPLVGWFGVDDTPPAAPKTFEFSNTAITRYGWTTSPLFAAVAAPGPYQGIDAAPLGGGAAAMITRDDADGKSKQFSPNGLPVAFPSEGHFRVESWYNDSAGNRGHSKPIFIGYDTNRPPAAVLHENDWVSRQKLIDGYGQSWEHVTKREYLEAGICGFIVAFDKEPQHTLSGDATIEGNVDTAPVPANIEEGHNFSHVATVSCAGLVADTADTPLPVDATNPEVSIDGRLQSDWSTQPLHLTLQPMDDLSGPKSLKWSIDGAPTQTETSEVEVEVGDGEHVLTTSATDNAGNVSASNSTVIQVDATAPVSWLGPTTGGRPNEFTAHVHDPVSGLDSAALQFRRVDNGATDRERGWRQAGAAYLPSDSPKGEHTFSRALDDSSLPDGEYKLQVVAVDRAGNTGYGSTLPAGGTVSVNLPLRQRPAVALAVSDMVRRCTSKSKRGCASSSRCRRAARCTFKWVTTRRGAGIDRIVDWGDREVLTGSVLSPNGAPLGGVSVSIHSTPHAGERALVASVLTGADGNFEWRIPNGPTRSFSATTGATDELASAETTATIAVRAGLSLALSDRTPRPGQNVQLTGRLASGSIGVPAGGKKITIEYWRDGKWIPTIGAPQTDGSGRFHVTWSIPRNASSGAVFLRAHAELQPTETTWPFEGGKSRTVRAEIRP